MLMFKANYKHIQDTMSSRIAKTMLNLMAKQGKLDRMIEITKEFNCLYY